MWQHFASNDPARVTNGLPVGALPPGSTGGIAVAEDDDEVKRVVRDLAPWAIAVVMHAGMVLLAILLVWANLKAQDRVDPIVPSFALNRPAERMQMRMEQRPTKVVNPVPPRGTESVVKQAPSTSSSAAALALTLGASGGENAPTGFSPSSRGTPTGFFNNSGPPGTNAKSFAYVIDASGSMVDTMPFVIRELKHSLRTLGESHTFTVIFYQNGQVIEPLTPGLKKATRENVSQMLNWLDEVGVAPNGLTSPLPAVQTALKYKPELIFLLSDNITGRGIYEIRQETLLSDVRAANPHATKINTIQFLHADPLTLIGMRGTLELISEQSGGLNRFVEPSDIWLDAPLSE